MRQCNHYRYQCHDYQKHQQPHFVTCHDSSISVSGGQSHQPEPEPWMRAAFGRLFSRAYCASAALTSGQPSSGYASPQRRCSLSARTASARKSTRFMQNCHGRLLAMPANRQAAMGARNKIATAIPISTGFMVSPPPTPAAPMPQIESTGYGGERAGSCRMA